MMNNLGLRFFHKVKSLHKNKKKNEYQRLAPHFFQIALQFWE